MIQWPARLGGKPKIVGWLNRLLDRSKASEIKNIIGGRIIETSDGKTLIVDPGHGSKSGWRWHDPKEYDSDEENYAVDDVVLVSPDNFDVAEGNCVAGLYVCLQTGTWADEGITIYYPIWPLPDPDPDHEDNYWMLIALYPTVMTYCLGGIDTEYFVNAQPVPEE